MKAYLLLLVSVLTSFSLQAKTETFRLTELFDGARTVRLEGSADSFTIPVTLNSIVQVDKALLKIEVVSSKALIKKRSQLYVRFNNATIGQVEYDPDRPALVSEITIPKSLWRVGFNALTFSVSQHYAAQCGNGNSPELWSEINAHNSSLTLTTSTKDHAFTLNELSGFFSPGVAGQREVALYTAKEPSAGTMEQSLPLVAQALALRNQYQPLHVFHRSLDDRYLSAETKDAERDMWDEEKVNQFHHSAWYLKDEEKQPVHVLVGTVSELSSVLTDDVINQIDTAFIETQTTPAFVVDNKVVVPASYRLIVSGKTHDDVMVAAKTLAVMDDELNSTNRIKVHSQSNVSAEILLRNGVLAPGSQYTFEAIGVDTQQFLNEGQFSQRVSLRLPADFYVPESANVELLLDFAYGAGFGSGSIMNVRVNNALVHGLMLNKENGTAYRDYQLNIPARFFKGGTNHIDFDITARAPLVGVSCDDIPGSHLIFQLNNASKIILPSAGFIAVQPNLALMSETAYPFARYKSAPLTTLRIPSLDFIDSALTLSGKFAQVAKSPILNFQISIGERKVPDGTSMILGTPQSLTQLDQGSFTTAVEKTNRWSYRLQNNLYNQIRTLSNDLSFKQMRVDGNTVQESSLGNQAVLTAHRHPNSNQDDTLFVLAAQTPELLEARVHDLVSLTMWGQLSGDFFAWNNALQPSLVMQVSEKYEVGEAGNSWLHLRLWLSNNPWYWLISFVVLVLLVSIVVHLLLKRRNKQVKDSW
ncbi:cellulose biosynthesis cyclic di-GMP-binding regulatory protein BcsB [Alteromonas sp. D210916BOD_24]|uniref:cellulose biosynthesis cyclic di-GMP-binding regulatory protein BcsB n=1 Tax=Alteromonas sp. D210916BOD_24 TaxID=3157618 RepID=UPI00399CD40C